MADREFNFIATYIDHVVADGGMFVAANGLFNRPPGRNLNTNGK